MSSAKPGPIHASCKSNKIWGSVINSLDLGKLGAVKERTDPQCRNDEGRAEQNEDESSPEGNELQHSADQTYRKSTIQTYKDAYMLINVMKGYKISLITYHTQKKCAKQNNFGYQIEYI